MTKRAETKEKKALKILFNRTRASCGFEFVSLVIVYEAGWLGEEGRCTFGFNQRYVIDMQGFSWLFILLLCKPNGQFSIRDRN